MCFFSVLSIYSGFNLAKTSGLALNCLVSIYPKSRFDSGFTTALFYCKHRLALIWANFSNFSSLFRNLFRLTRLNQVVVFFIGWKARFRWRFKSFPSLFYRVYRAFRLVSGPSNWHYCCFIWALSAFAACPTLFSFFLSPRNIFYYRCFCNLWKLFCSRWSHPL